jgi:hypothetical protein
MSYTYLQDAGAESSAASFSDITRFAPLKSNPTVAACSCNGSGTACCHGSQSGMTCEPSTGSRGADVLMSSAVDSPAKTFQPPEMAAALTMREVDCGEKWQGWFAKWDQDSCSWRTPQCSLFEDLELSWLTWPRWGMMRNGVCWELPTLERPTSENESGYWPTPEASLNIAPYSPKTARNWGGERKSGAKIGSSLRWFPEFLPDSDAGGKWVNPDLCEMMMGWPLLWTDCTPLEMDRFQAWLHSHGDFFGSAGRRGLGGVP